MIEWIVFGIIALIISEIIFFIVGKSDEWFMYKFMSICFGLFISLVFWLFPYWIAFDCGDNLISGCTNYGMQVFYWHYGVTIGVALLFYLNKKLIVWKEKKEDKDGE